MNSWHLPLLYRISAYSELTSKARAALPDMVSHKDAVYNLSRAALATAAFCDGDYSLLGVATKDSLHQKYRLPLIDGGDEMFELAQDLGALAVYISGAGPTIMAVVPRDDQEFFARAALPQSEKLKHFFTVYRLLPDNTGATVGIREQGGRGLYGSYRTKVRRYLGQGS